MKNSRKSTNRVEGIKQKVLRQDNIDRPKGPITATNIGQHREATIKTAKKYKYPFQQAKYKVLIGASVALVVVLAAFTAFSWWMLYVKQDTSDFYYTATKFIPIPVAEVDGEKVPYGDYMRRVRASIYYLENQENRDLSTSDGQRELNYTRRVNLEEAERVAYAEKIAKEQDISVTEEEINDNIATALNTGSDNAISERAFENSIWRYYGWDMRDYRHIVKNRLLLRKAMFAVDTEALGTINSLEAQLDQGGDFAELAKNNSDDEITRDNGGDVGVVGVDNIDNNGLIAAAKSLNQGETSGVIEGVDAFYIIKLTNKTDTTVHFSQIKVSLKEFDKRFSNLGEQGKIVEYITIETNE